MNGLRQQSGCWHIGKLSVSDAWDGDLIPQVGSGGIAGYEFTKFERILVLVDEFKATNARFMGIFHRRDQVRLWNFIDVNKSILETDGQNQVIVTNFDAGYRSLLFLQLFLNDGLTSFVLLILDSVKNCQTRAGSYNDVVLDQLNDRYPSNCVLVELQLREKFFMLRHSEGL